MTNPSTPRRRLRRTALAAAGVSLIATISPVISANPAGAATAPLATDKGVGIRLDENAILGPALEEIETALQPFVNTKISQGAVANSVMDDPDWADGSANVELSFDFINAGSPGYTLGGLTVHADLQDIRMRFYRYGEWWQPECLIYVEPEDGAIDASAYIDTSKLPNAPLTLNPIDATWDNDPEAFPAPGYSWLCNGYLIDEWWDGLWGDGTDVAAQLEAELNAEAQDLINGLWTDYVTPVLDSLLDFGITFDTVKTDDHGLIVMADVDSTNGITIPGDTVARSVVNAQDSGATSNVNTLLATRASDAIVSIHPNVANQFLFALRTALNGQFGAPTVSSSIESVLLDPSKYGDYADNGWTVSLSTNGANNAPYLTTPGGGVAPTVNLPGLRLVVRNTSKGTSPVGVFDGTGANVLLDTVVRPSGDVWGPGYVSSSMTVSLTRTQGNADVVAFNGNPNNLLPYAKAGVDYFDTATFQEYVGLAPVEIGNLDVDLCTACGQYSGDERYTETFIVS